MQPARQVAQLGEAVAQLVECGGERRARVVGQLAVRREPDLQSERDREEPLLGAVVEIALDVAACAVGSVQDARARRANLGQLRLDDLALAQRLLRRAAGGHVEDRAVEPAAAVAGRLCVPTLEHPAHGSVPMHEPVLERERPSRGHGLHDRARHVLVVVGMLDARERPHRAADEVARGVAGHHLDLVAQPLHRPVEIARTAIEGAGDVVDQRAQQRLAGPQPRRAQSRRDAHGEHLRLERDAHDVIRSRVQRIAQHIRRGEIGSDDDVDGGELGPRAHRARQRRRLPHAGHHDLGGAFGHRAERLGRRGESQDAEPGGGELGPRRVAELLQSEHEHVVPWLDEAGQRAGTARVGTRGPRAPTRFTPPRGPPVVRHRDDHRTGRRRGGQGEPAVS